MFSCSPFKVLREKVPGMQAILAPPIAVDALARVAVAAATNKDNILERLPPSKVLSIEDLQRESK